MMILLVSGVAYHITKQNQNDAIDLIEKHSNVYINVYTHDKPELLQFDKRCICNYNEKLNLMRYDNHFMYIKD